MFLPYIFGKRFHTIAGQDRIGLVAAFGRRKTFQDNAFKRDVLIVYDRTDCIVDLRQFQRIVTEIRQDRIFSHLEVQISSPHLGTMFYRFRFRRDISQGRLHLIPLVGTGQDLVGHHEQSTLFLFSTTAHVRDQHEASVFHPRLKRDYRLIVDDAFALSGLHDQKAGFILQVVQSDLAVIHFLTDPSVQQDGRQPFLLRSRFQDRCQGEVIARFDLTAVDRDHGVDHQFVSFLFQFVTNHFYRGLSQDSRRNDSQQSCCHIYFHCFLHRSDYLIK